MKKILKHLRKNWIRHGFETLAVIVGVLIAFSLNNWNEARKDRESEVKILKELRDDLEDNYDEISGINVLTKSAFHSIDSLIYILDNVLPSRNDTRSYDVLFAHTGWFNSANTAYKYIEGSGMKVLRNDSIRILTTHMYEENFKNIITVENRLEKIYQDFFPFLRSNFVFTRQPGHNNRLAPIDSDDLCTNATFRNLLAQRANQLEIRNRENKAILAELRSLISMIDIEIHKLGES